jgi:membrane protein
MSRRSTRGGGRHAAGTELTAAPANATTADAEAATGLATSAAETERPPRALLVSSPVRLDRHAWWAVLRRAVREYRTDDVSDWAAALTYRAILALFPGMLVLIAIIGLLGSSTSQRLQSNIEQHAPDSTRSTINAIFNNARNQHSVASVIGIAALLVALWSASGYVAAFMRASNAIYDIGEGRPIWKTTPIRLGVTVTLVVAVVASAAIALLSRGIARDVGNAVGLGPTAVDVWNIAKWPLLVVIASLTLALLYWAAPNARQAGFTWISPGGLFAVLVWAAASIGFGTYVTHFSSYNKTYGSLAGIVIFLIWLWISNIALLLGAELNAELQRARAIAAGLPENQEPYVVLRDTRKLDEFDRERAEALSRHLHSA